MSVSHYLHEMEHNSLNSYTPNIISKGSNSVDFNKYYEEYIRWSNYNGTDKNIQEWFQLHYPSNINYISQFINFVKRKLNSEFIK